ncbi:hypothetical protein Axi01nite_71890 [Actinoplanes xinjiangensis]|nr:hypothetical protein Axi01nite_71890 [Actinoplanes xinjiangensis]
MPVIDLHTLSFTLTTISVCRLFNGDYGSGPVGALFRTDHTHFEAPVPGGSPGSSPWPCTTSKSLPAYLRQPRQSTRTPEHPREH